MADSYDKRAAGWNPFNLQPLQRDAGQAGVILHRQAAGGRGNRWWRRVLPGQGTKRTPTHHPNFYIINLTQQQQRTWRHELEMLRFTATRWIVFLYCIFFLCIFNVKRSRTMSSLHCLLQTFNAEELDVSRRKRPPHEQRAGWY